jgi:hypothetical protein
MDNVYLRYISLPPTVKGLTGFPVRRLDQKGSCQSCKARKDYQNRLRQPGGMQKNNS